MPETAEGYIRMLGFAFPENCLAFLVFLLLIISYTFFKLLTSAVMPMKWCRYDYYYSRKYRTCLPCAIIRCQPGFGLNYNCGYNEHGYRVKATCSPCKEGFYSVGYKKDIFSNIRPTFCRKCRRCSSPRKIERSCTRYHDVQCSSCPTG